LRIMLHTIRMERAREKRPSATIPSSTHIFRFLDISIR
jgi:hypothetical protein